MRRVFLSIPKRRYRCPVDGRIHTAEIEWIELGVRVTKQFAVSVNRLTAITTNQEAGWYLGLNEKVYRIDTAMLAGLFEKRLIPTPQSVNISVDEVAGKKQHRYLTNVIDTDEKVVTWNHKGRKAEVLDSIISHWERRIAEESNRWLEMGPGRISVRRISMR
jgi:transposase